MKTEMNTTTLTTAAQELRTADATLEEVAATLYSGDGCEAPLEKVAAALYSEDGCDAYFKEVAVALYSDDGCDATLDEITKVMSCF